MADLGISNPVTNCLKLFQRLLSVDSPTSTNTSNQSILSSLREEEARFKVWVGNIGAHKTGRSSLEYRLRDASHIQKQVVELIADLTGLVEDARAIITGEKTPWDELEGDDESLLDEMGLKADSDDDEFPETELGQIATDVADVINCLLRLSVAIRNPAPHDRFAASGTAIDTDHFEPFDIQHVEGKFSQVDKDLATRLGKAISRRRQYFKYRESHHSKLSEGISAEPSAPKDTVSTIASSIPEETKGLSFDRTQLVSMDEDAISDSGVSQTSFASSIAETETLKIPPLPKEAEKGPFECPFCFMMISTTTTISWRYVSNAKSLYYCQITDYLTDAMYLVTSVPTSASPKNAPKPAASSQGVTNGLHTNSRTTGKDMSALADATRPSPLLRNAEVTWAALTRIPYHQTKSTQ